MYGFTDGEHKLGRVLFDSLLLVEGAQLVADALRHAAMDLTVLLTGLEMVVALLLKTRKTI